MIDGFLPFDADEPEPQPVVAVVPPAPVPVVAAPVVKAARVVGVTIRQEAHRRQLSWGLFVDTHVGGDRVVGSKFFATEAEAEAQYPAAAADVTRRRTEHADALRLKAALNVPALPQAPKGTVLFETLVHRWLNERVKPQQAASTYIGYEGLMRNHLLPIMRTWPVSDTVIDRNRVKLVLRDELRRTGRSVKTRRAAQRCLVGFFKWALTEVPAQLRFNPASGLLNEIRHTTEMLGDGLVADPDKEPNPMTRVQVEAFLKWQQEHYPQFYELFLFLVDGGVRVGEAAALKVDRLDLERGKAHIVQTFSGAKRKLELEAEKTQRKGLDGRGEKMTKTRQRYQFIDLSDRVIAALAALRSRHLEAWLKRGRHGKEPQHVFLNSRLQPRRPDKIVYRAFRAGCNALQLKGESGEPFTIHALRATFITLSLLEGRSVGWVVSMVGHKDETTLRRFYLKWIRLTEENPLAGVKW